MAACGQGFKPGSYRISHAKMGFAVGGHDFLFEALSFRPAVCRNSSKAAELRYSEVGLGYEKV